MAAAVLGGDFHHYERRNPHQLHDHDRGVFEWEGVDMNRPGSRPTRDVQDKLRANFKSKRERGGVPYPVKHSHSQLAYDSWNQMFLATLSQEPGQQSIALHQFESPPKKVLDLGCGSGFWILEAATKHWKDTLFVGLDILEIQPKLSAFTRSFGADRLQERIQWVKANFLDGLPFEDGAFDFVRVCGLGLAVPEDEWPSLLQEVRRVLEVGGVVEIIEEDLIFPAAPVRKPAHNGYANGSSFSLPLTNGSVFDHSFSFSASSALGSNSPPRRFADPHGDSPPYNHSHLHYDTSSGPGLSNQGRPSGITTGGSNKRSQNDPTDFPDARDHSRLKEAWHSMLHRRFLVPRITSVLPFYIASSFQDMQTHPAMHITLPPNSGTTDALSSSYSSSPYHDGGWGYGGGGGGVGGAGGGFGGGGFGGGFGGGGGGGGGFGGGGGGFGEFDWRMDDNDGDGMGMGMGGGMMMMDEPPMHSRRSTMLNQRSAMHLARAVNLVEGCKDAIWEEYELLAAGPITSSSSSSTSTLSGSSSSSSAASVNSASTPSASVTFGFPTSPTTWTRRGSTKWGGGGQDHGGHSHHASHHSRDSQNNHRHHNSNHQQHNGTSHHPNGNGHGRLNGPGNNGRSHHHQHLHQPAVFNDAHGRLRTEFETAWSNWSNDMKDRMALRGSVNKWLDWNMNDIERPEWGAWRDRVNPVDLNMDVYSSPSCGLNPHESPDQICRSLRGFVAWNVTESPGEGLNEYGV